MAIPKTPKIMIQRVFDVALDGLKREEQRMLAVIECENLPVDERFAAMVELATWSQKLRRTLADAA